MEDSTKKINEITAYITRMVPDIARKCGCKEDVVWHAIALHPHFTSNEKPF